MNNLIRSVALAAAFGSTAAAASAQTAPATPAQTAPAAKTAPAQAASHTTAPVVAAGPTHTQNSEQQAVSVQRSDKSADRAVQRQVEYFHILMPALSGDGGG